MAFNAYQQPYNYGNQNYTTLPSYGGFQQQYVAQQYQQPTQQYQVQQPMIYGKVVENAEIVKIQEIPLGGAGVFPQADGSYIYLKKFMPDGSTQVVTYSPVSTENKSEQKNNEYSDLLTNIQKQIEELDKKVSTLV